MPSSRPPQQSPFDAHDYTPIPSRLRAGPSAIRVALCFALAMAFPSPFGLTLFGLTLGNDLRVNEFQASNVSTVTDEDGDNSDWVEISNESTMTIDLDGYGLSDDPTNLGKWTFPAVSLGAGDILLVFCSDKNRVDPFAPLHTNFKLSSQGEYLALTPPGGVTPVSEFAPTYPPQFDDVSFGFDPSDELRYFESPTPNAPNGPGALGVLATPTVDVLSGFFDSATMISLQSPDPAAMIYVTTDGSAPSILNGTLYTAPLSIDSTTVLRAIATRSDFLDSAVTTRTYLFLNDVIQQPFAIPGYPNNPYSVGAGGQTAVHDYEMDPQVVGNPAYTPEMIPALRAIPTLSIVTDPNQMFGLSGFYDGDDEQPASIELLFPEDPARNEQVMGGVQSHSDLELKRSLRLEFKAIYGATKWETTLFDSSSLTAPAAGEYDRIVLRAGANRSWARNWNPDLTAYTIDPFYRGSQIALSGFGSRSAFVHLYINGLYWGLYNPVERPDEDFSSEYFGGGSGDWFATSHSDNPVGDSSQYDELFDTLINLDLSDPVNYASVEAILDIDAFAEYLILNWWSGTGDWPLNNWWIGNRSTSSPDGPTLLRYYAWDGEWSWDAPFGFSNPGFRAHVHPQFRTTAAPVGDISRLWQALRANPEFMLRFADRVQAACFNAGALADANALDRWLALNATIESAVVAESARWGDALESLGFPLRTRDLDWQTEVDTIATLLDGNADTFISALRQEGYFPDVDVPIFDPYGGEIPPSDSIALSLPAGATGAIYYTTDGSDPRLGGGSLNPSAQLYSTPLFLSQATTIRARTLDGLDWSALEVVPYTLSEPTPLRLTEFMYHPSARTADEIAAGVLDDDDFEYVELENTGPESIELADFAFVDGIDYVFPATTLSTGGIVIVAKDPAAFAIRYPTVTVPVLGPYSGSLSNGGEALRLDDSGGSPVHNFEYDDQAPWPLEADGLASSLEVLDANGDYNSAANWEASDPLGSPGQSTLGPPATPSFIRGDCNGDLASDISDPVALLAQLFPSGPVVSIPCESACDANDDAAVNIADVVAMLAALFGTSTRPPQPLPAPGAACGPDPTPDSIPCDQPRC